MITVAVVGAGSRGSTYADHMAESGSARIVAVADTDADRRGVFAERHAIPEGSRFASWEDLVRLPKVADAVVVATPDRMHLHPAVAFADSGYNILLEKPMAPTETEALQIVAAAERNDVILAVCHVMRYTDYTRVLRDLIASGRIGDVISVDHLEPVGWWHFAHSYVRGNWRREADSSSMLLAKACHDVDWIMHVLGQDVARVSSFGGLRHFRPENKPADAADRCLDCPVAPECPYDATRIYGRFLGDPVHEAWPLSVLTLDTSPAGLEEALRTGPYGVCVYNGQNDVADHQVVALEMADGTTASVTVSAFTKMDFRKTRVHGTHGYLEGDGMTWRHVDFNTAEEEIISTAQAGEASAAGGHGGADKELALAFVEAVATSDAARLTSGPQASLASHRVVWAAEEARRTGQVVAL